MKLVKRIKRLTPRRANAYRRRHTLQVSTAPNGRLNLSIQNPSGSWTTSIALELDEVALLQRMLAEHVEAVTFALKADEDEALFEIPSAS